MNEELEALIQRYRRSPEFVFVEITDPNQQGMTGDTLLHAAVVRGALDDVELLISSGAQVNAIGDLGNTPLHYAAGRGFEDIVRKLVQCGADPTQKNEFGQTPSDIAELNGHSNVVGMLKRAP